MLSGSPGHNNHGPESGAPCNGARNVDQARGACSYCARGTAVRPSPKCCDRSVDIAQGAIRAAQRDAGVVGVAELAVFLETFVVEPVGFAAAAA